MGRMGYKKPRCAKFLRRRFFRDSPHLSYRSHENSPIGRLAFPGPTVRGGKHSWQRDAKLSFVSKRVPKFNFGTRGWSNATAYASRFSFVTRPVGTHSTTKMFPSLSKQASCGCTNLPG